MASGNLSSHQASLTKLGGLVRSFKSREVAEKKMVHIDDQLKVAFSQFQQDPLERFRVKVRRKRAAQLRHLLAQPEAVSLELFNHEVWPLEESTCLRSGSKSWQIFGPSALSGEQVKALEQLLENDELEFHGNYVWGSGTKIYAPQLKDEIQKIGYVRQALEILNRSRLTPTEKANQIDEIYGFGRISATGLVMLYHPGHFAIYNEQSERALTLLGHDAGSLERFQAAISLLKETLGAEDYLELDFFLYLMNQGQFHLHLQPPAEHTALHKSDSENTILISHEIEQEPSKPMRTLAFISHSYKDARYLKELQVHLASHARNGEFVFWDATKISPGSQWRDEVEKALASAKVAILLVSADFLASEFIAEKELPALLAAAKEEGARILPVILRPSAFPDTKLAQFQAVNQPSEPVSGMSRVKREELWVQVARLVKEALKY